MTARAEATTATGERILNAAWQHFATRPYEQVLMREIAADADVTAQTIHTRFGAKDDLLTAAYRWWGRQESARRDTAPPGDTNRAIQVVFDHYEAHGEAILRMQAQEDRIPAIRQMTDLGRAYHRAWNQRVFAPLLEALTEDARERRLLALIAATDVYVWKLLRRDLRLSRQDAERTVAEMITA